jgi:signal transduction histidine kinase
MNPPLDFFLIFIFSSIIIFIIHVLIFLRGRPLQTALLNFTAALMILFPLVFELTGEYMTVFLRPLTCAGLTLFSVTFSYMMKVRLIANEKFKSLWVAVPTGMLIPLLMIFPEQSYIITSTALSMGTLYCAVNLVMAPGGSIMRVIMSVSAAGIGTAAWFIYNGNIEASSLTASAVSSVSYIFLTMNFRDRVYAAVSQVAGMSDTNLKLAHTIARYRQSNENYRRIIVEKEMELFQMARHASLAELTAGIAHELSQPITGIKGIAQNMIDDINLEELEPLQAVSDLTRISALVDKSSAIIDRVRNFTRRRAFQNNPVDLNSVIMNSIELLRSQVRKNDIEILFVLDDQLPLIMGDSLSLEQLIINLILNSKDAITEKYSKGGDKNGQITVSTLANTLGVRLSISDNGTGIPEDIIQRIWSPFFTTKKRDNGTGIGLSISRKIIRDHRAKSEVTSGEWGTSFDIYFPSV